MKRRVWWTSGILAVALLAPLPRYELGGGHLWVGHHDQIMAELLAFLGRAQPA